MDTNTILNIVKVLVQDTTVIQDWQRLAYALGAESTALHQLQLRYMMGLVNAYSLFTDVLQSWVSRIGGGATVERLVDVLRTLGFVYCAEMVPMELRIVAQPPAATTAPASVFSGMPGNLVFRERLDYGAFGEVFKVDCMLTKKAFAVKRISLGRFVELTNPNHTTGTATGYFKLLLREVRVMAVLQGERIVRYQDAWFEGPLREELYTMLRNLDPEEPSKAQNMKNSGHRIVATREQQETYMCIKMELMDTNLWHHFQLRDGNIGKTYLARNVTTQVLEGLVFMHARQIIHRDLKPNNILLNLKDSDDVAVKIADFGLSREVSENDTHLSIGVGTREFSSPEMHRGLGSEYTFKTDIFSVGLICLTMLYKFKTTKEMQHEFDNIRMTGSLQIVENIEKSQGQRGFDLLRHMLTNDPQHRPTAQDALDKITRNQKQL